MLSPAENERLTRVGPGTPCGELIRRDWIPIVPYVQLREDPVRKVRVLGEDLVLYKNRQGGLGLIGDRCLHRCVDLQWGIPDDNGLRCPYHGRKLLPAASAPQTRLRSVTVHGPLETARRFQSTFSSAA